MADYSTLAIFWMSFGAFIGPVFLIALIFSILKAIRTRKEVLRRAGRIGNPNAPLDAEIITQSTPQRRKPNIKLIEDIERKRQFRSVNGSLVQINSSHVVPPKQRRYKDTAVDVPNTVGVKGFKNKNRSNSAGGGDRDIEMHHHQHPHANKNHHSNKCANQNSQSNNNHYSRSSHSLNGDVVIDCENPYSNKIAAFLNNNGRSRSGARRSSMGDGIPMSSYSYTVPNSNGHAIISDGAYYKGVSSLYRHDNTPGLSPHSYIMNHKRRHSVNSTSPTLERIPEVKCVEVELNAPRSKSEDNLVEQQSYAPSPYLTTGDRGINNKGFARSTETTIM